MSELAATPGLTMWVVYDHPKDYPTAIVVRPQTVMPDGSQLFGGAWFPKTVERARDVLSRMGLTRIDRDPNDDPVIVESWM